jgi:hypothetical protein
MSLRRAVLVGLVISLGLVCVGRVVRPDPINDPQPGTAEWLRDTSASQLPPDPATASPAAVARFFATLSTSEQASLADRYPAVVGNLDGAPPELRFAANARKITATGGFTDLARSGGRILAFDPRGRGLVVEVLGDLATADRIAVVVPGNDADLSHFSGPRQILGLADALRAGLVEQQPGARVAVIAWAGYRAPGGLGMDALRGDLARTGADRFVRFLAGLAAYRPVPVSLFCHSYGSLVCAFAASRVDVTDIVAFGSPGMRVRTAAALQTSARVWTALAEGDWVGTVPHVEILGLGHGPSPVSRGFGARVVVTDGARGHLGYLTPGTTSLRNFTRIAVGDYTDVTYLDGWTCGDA